MGKAIVKEATLNKLRSRFGPQDVEGVAEVWRIGAGVSDGAGGVTGAEPFCLTNPESLDFSFPCRVNYVGMSMRHEKVIASQIRSIGDYLISLPAFTEVEQRDVIHYLGKPWASGALVTAGAQYAGPNPNNGFVYRALQGGTTGTDSPAWTEGEGTLVVDGSVIWECSGRPQRFEVVEIMAPSTYEIARKLLCNELKGK